MAIKAKRATRAAGTVLERIFNEVKIYGGLPMRRGDIAVLAREHMGPEAREPFGPQYFAFHGPAVDMEPWPLDEARRICNGENLNTIIADRKAA